MANTNQKEWKVIVDDEIVTQKLLNTWRHKYHIVVHGVTYDPNHNFIITIITRQEKTD